MMTATDRQRTTEAINWLIRQQDAGFSDWGRFTAWLEEDPANSREYDRLALVESDVIERLVCVPVARPNGVLDSAGRIGGRPTIARRGIIGIALAAAATVALVVLPNPLHQSRSMHAVTTPAGVRHEIVLASGTTVTLNGGTRVMLDRADPQFAEMIYGEASFDIASDRSGQFEVRVAGARLVDIGTRFNVVRADGVTTVAVVDGAIDYSSDNQRVRVDAGQQLTETPGEMRLARVDPAAIDSWREGRLIFTGDPLTVVAKALARNIGVPVRVDRSVAAMPVNAVIQLPANGNRFAPEQLERLLGIKVERDQRGWTLTSTE